jgi:hypothetical protein
MHPYDRQAAGSAITNTTTETSLYSKAIGGGDLGIWGTFDLVIYGDMLHNTADPLTWRIKWGSGIVRMQNADSSSVIPTGSGSVPYELRVQLWNNGGTSSQILWATLMYWSPAGAAGTTGIGNFNGSASAGVLGGIMADYPSIDTTVGQTFDITVQWSAASANNSIRRVTARALLGQN